jgi:hypothetical protein
MSNQSEGKAHIQHVLRNQGVETDVGIVVIAGVPWEVFEYEMRCIAIDPDSGVWIGPSGGQWACIDKRCTVSSALQAVEFLLNASETRS